MTKNKEAGSAVRAQTVSASKKTKGQRGPVTRYAAVRLQQTAASTRAKVAGNSNPRIIEDVNNLDAAESLFQPTAATVAKVVADTESAYALKAQAERNLEQGALPVLAVLRVTARGREFARGCKGRNPELTMANLISRLPGSGFIVPAELIAAMQGKADAAKQASQKLADVLPAKATAVQEFMAAKKQLQLAVKQLKATWIAYQMGKGIPTRPGRSKKKAEVAPSQPIATEPTTPVEPQPVPVQPLPIPQVNAALNGVAHPTA